MAKKKRKVNDAKDYSRLRYFYVITLIGGCVHHAVPSYDGLKTTFTT